MKQSLNFLALLLVLSSCQKGIVDRQDPNSELQTTASKSTASSQYTYLSVQVVSETGYEIKSDGLGGAVTPDLYIDGQLSVRAELQHSSGDFYMMSNTLLSKPARRFFKFPGNSDLEGKNDYRIRVKDDEDLVSIQSMGTGYPESMVMHLWSYDNKANKLFDILFNPQLQPGTDKVTVTRIDADKWEVVPVSPATAAILRVHEPEEKEPVPFKLILRRKNK